MFTRKQTCGVCGYASAPVVHSGEYKGGGRGKRGNAPRMGGEAE